MSLASVLVDTGHFTHEGSTGARVNGKTPVVPVSSQQFSCRASNPSTTELRNDQVQFQEYQRDITLLTDIVYADGRTPIDLHENWRVVVEAGPYAGMYVMMGEPTPIRKKGIDDVIAYQFALRHYDAVGR